MLSDEEKKAIESLIEIREFANLSSYKDIKINQLNSIDIVLNLIEKQTKELEKKEFHLKATEQQREYDIRMIDDLKGQLNNKIDLIKEQQKEIEELKEKNEYLPSWVNKKYVSKDKIKAILEEVDYKMIAHQDVREAVKQVLNSLLEKE